MHIMGVLRNSLKDFFKTKMFRKSVGDLALDNLDQTHLPVTFSQF